MHFDRTEEDRDTGFMKKIKTKLILFSFLSSIILLPSCASKSRPQLYPNEILKQRGQDQANQDIDKCMKEAEDYFNTPEGKEAAKGSPGYGTMVGTSVGFGMGTTGVGIGVGMGGSDRGMSPSDVRKAFVNQCLLNKGYQVLSWR